MKDFDLIKEVPVDEEGNQIETCENQDNQVILFLSYFTNAMTGFYLILAMFDIVSGAIPIAFVLWIFTTIFNQIIK